MTLQILLFKKMRRGFELYYRPICATNSLNKTYYYGYVCSCDYINHLSALRQQAYCFRFYALKRFMKFESIFKY